MGAELEDPMRTMKPATASDVLLSSGSNHVTALAQTEETKPLIGAFQPALDELQTAVVRQLAIRDAFPRR